MDAAVEVLVATDGTNHHKWTGGVKDGAVIGKPVSVPYYLT